MCDCSSTCVPQGPAGRGITNIVDNGDATLTITYTDGTSQIIPFLSVTIPPAPALEKVLISNVLDTDLSADANFVGNTYFQFAGLGYETLIYKNTSGVSKDYIVTATANIGTNAISPNEYGRSEVDMAIETRDALLVDTQVSSVEGRVSINQDSTLNPGDINPTIYFIKSVLVDKVEVTLADGESVLLKFRTKDAFSGFLKKATLEVIEK